MYPTLTPVGKSSHWYTEKQTIQEKAQEITDLEERLDAKRLNDIQVGIPIWIRGQPILPTKILSITGDRDEDEDEPMEEEAMDDDGLDEADTSASHLPADDDDFHNGMYDQQQQQLHDDDDGDDGMQQQAFDHSRYDSDESLWKLRNTLDNGRSWRGVSFDLGRSIVSARLVQHLTFPLIQRVQSLRVRHHRH
ncbi:hypothetical protein MBANPS3_005254 [Mucor bainieri]